MHWKMHAKPGAIALEPIQRCSMVHLTRVQGFKAMQTQALTRKGFQPAHWSGDAPCLGHWRPFPDPNREEHVHVGIKRATVTKTRMAPSKVLPNLSHVKARPISAACFTDASRSGMSGVCGGCGAFALQELNSSNVCKSSGTGKGLGHPLLGRTAGMPYRLWYSFSQKR